MNDDAVQKGDLFAPPFARQRPAGAPVIPVSAFVASARQLLERQGLAWIGGEVSGCSRAASGHIYFTLKDPNAQIRCVFFRHKAQGLAFTLREGLAVEVRATPTIYDARGEFQLNVETVRLAGVGALYERFLQLKSTLAAAGLFDAARKRALPAYPRRVGIVTSRHAAAFRDVLTTLRRRFPCIPVVLYPASVQGAAAAAEIAAAIRLANRHAWVDVLIVCRGGGSLEDLWAFNEEIVARAIFDSALPVVSGVGHETDFTICDFVADVRAPTPTGAAALVVPERAALWRLLVDLSRRFVRSDAHRMSSRTQYVDSMARRLVRAEMHRMSHRAQRLDSAARRLVHPAARLAQQAERMHALGRRLHRAFAQRHAIDVRRLGAAHARLAREMRSPLPQSARVVQAVRALQRTGRDRLERASRLVHRLDDALSLLNPQAVLERGYAIVTAREDEVVSDSRQVRAGDDVELRFARGRAAATVRTTAIDADSSG
jgi:exodeoxyribonuclease VII large subunit